MHSPTFPTNTHPNGRVTSSGPQANARPGPDAQPQAAENGRDTHGRFGKGNAGGPGNPFARQVAALRCALLAAVSEKDMEEVTQTLARQAKEGNVAAAKLLLSYSLGKPAPTVDPDTLDQQEWEGYRRLPDAGPELASIQQRMPLPLACHLLRAMLPALANDWRRQMQQQMQDREAEERADAADRAERLARRAARKAQRAPAPAAEDDAGKLELLHEWRLLTGQAAPTVAGAPSANGCYPPPGGAPPSANGVAGRPGPRPPSANG
jgi:hypothetical protein